MTIQLTLEVQEAQMILGALGKLPLEQSLDLWAKVKTQAQQQLQPAPVAAPAAEPASDSAEGSAA